MRTTAAWTIGLSLCLLAGRATATDTKGDTGGKGGRGPAAAGGTDTSTSDEVNVPRQHAADTSGKKTEEEKPWELGAEFTTHRMFVQDSLDTPQNRVFNVLGAYGLYRLSPRDTIGISEYFTEDFLADPGESGVRSQDIGFSYTRLVPLPRDFLFSGTISFSAPTSLTSQKAGLITRPGLTLSLDKKIGRYANVGLHASGGVFLTRFAESEGGNANALANVGFTLNAEVVMPFHEPLSIGASVQESYVWFYQVQSSDPSVVSPGVVADATYPNQPVQQSYGGQIFLRYTLPSLAGIKSDILLAASQGDPDIGFTSYLHQGVGYVYLFFRESSEGYVSLNVRY